LDNVFSELSRPAIYESAPNNFLVIPALTTAPILLRTKKGFFVFSRQFSACAKTTKTMRSLSLLSTVLWMGMTATAQTLLLEENFEGGGLPAGWTVEAAPGSDGWRFGTAAELSALATLIFPEHGRFAATNDETCNCNKSNERLILPPQNFSAHPHTYLLFDSYFLGFSFQGTAESARIQVSTNGGESWSDAFVVPAFNGWKRYAVNLSAYSGAASVTVAFRYSDGGGWNLGWGVDNVVLLAPPSTSVQLLSFNHQDQEYLPVGSHPVAGKIVNQGANTLTDTRFTLTLNGATVLTETVSGLNVAPFDTANFYLNGSLTVTAPTMYDAELRVSMPNGQNDPLTDDDAIALVFGGISVAPPRRVLLEAHTGAAFGDCPPTGMNVQQILDAYTQSLGYSMHHVDDLALTQSDTFRNATGLTIFPSATVDRRVVPGESGFFVRPPRWNAAVAYRQSRYAPVSVGVSEQIFDPATRTLTATVRADFFGPVSGDLRFNLFIVEDSVMGVPQANDYNNDYTSPFYLNGNPIQMFVHRRVLRAMLGGTWGTAGAIPASVGDGQSFSHTYTYVFAQNVNLSRVRLIAVVQRFDPNPFKRSILNAGDAPFQIFQVWPASANLICGESVTFTVPNPPPGFTFHWSPNVGILNNQNGVTVTAAPTSGVTYTVTAIHNTTGQSFSRTVPVTIDVGLEITSSAQVVCQGTPVILNAFGGQYYTWSPATGLSATTGSEVVATPMQTTTYTVTGANLSGTCVGTATVTVVVVGALNFSIPEPTICAGRSVTVSASGGNVYQWSPPDYLSSPHSATVTITPLSDVTYTVTAYSAEGCTLVRTFAVTLRSAPQVYVPQGESVSVCPGGMTGLSVRGALSYVWNPPLYLSSTVDSNIVCTPLESTTYTVTGYDLYGCEGVATVAVAISPTLPVNVSSDKGVICGSGSMTLTASGATNYVWEPAEGLSATTGESVVASPVVTTTYTVRGTAAEGCDGTATFTVRIQAPPFIAATADRDTITPGQTTVLRAFGAQTYQWKPTQYVTGSGSVVTVEPPVTTTFTVVGADADGCADSVQIRVVVDTSVSEKPPVRPFELKIYPNPSADGKIFVETKEILGELFVYDALGRLIRREVAAREYDFSELGAGMYLLKCRAPDGREATFKWTRR
jgi:hypothetical protein